MAAQERDQTVQLGEVFRRLVRRWRLIVAVTVVFAIAGAVYSFLQEEQYTASATLTVSPITTNPFNAGAVNQQINITTEREILSSREVARMAADSLGQDVTPAELLAGSEVSAPSGSQVLEVTATADRPEDAADYANALAEAYLEFRAEGAAEVALGFIDDLDRRIAGLEQADALDPAGRAELSSLRDQRASLSLVAENPGRIIGEAAPPSSPSSPGFTSWILIGTALGLLVGTAAAFFRDRFDPFIRTASKMRERTGVRVIAFRTDDDAEAARWTVRALMERRRAADASGSSLRVLLIDLDGRPLRRLVEGLREVLDGTPLRARVIVADDASFHVGWQDDPRAGEGGGEIVFIDASAVADAPSRAVLADSASCVVIVASPRSRGAALESVLRDVGPSTPAPVFVFVEEVPEPSARGRRHRRPSDVRAPVEEPAP